MNTKPDCRADLDRIQAEALKLSAADREKLLESLLASLDGPCENDDPGPSFATPELEQYWIEESHRRMKLIESGEMATYPAEEVIARLRDRLRR
jgi:Putative addiction module component